MPSNYHWTPKKLKRGKKYDVTSVVVLQGIEYLTPEDVIVAYVPGFFGRRTWSSRH
jgi:hypothetical protein